MVKNVYNTANTLVCSRSELLSWLSKILNKQYKKIEEMSDGVGYCLIMNILFENCIIVSKIIKNCRLERDKLHNWKLLQEAFIKLKIERNIQAIKLVKSRFLDNLEFAQWFKCFYDANVKDLDESDVNTTISYDDEQINIQDNIICNNFENNEDEANLTQDICDLECENNLSKNTINIVNVEIKSNKKIINDNEILSNKNIQVLNTKTNNTPIIEKTNSSPSLLEANDQLNEIIHDLEIAVKERQFYYNKLRKIEIILEEYLTRDNYFAMEIYNILYENDEGLQIPNNEQLNNYYQDKQQNDNKNTFY